MRENLHIAMTHAPHEVEEQDVAVDQTHGPKPHQGGSCDGRTHHQAHR